MAHVLLLTSIFVTHVLSSNSSISEENLHFDSYYGTRISAEELEQREKANTTFYCVTTLKPCDRKEGRRLDGSCNNLDHPTRGAAHTPFRRVLPAVFGPPPKFKPRSSASGGPLPPVRFLRTNLLAEGKASSTNFTQLLMHYMLFAVTDCVTIHDTINYVRWKPYCCLPKGKLDEMCAPNEIPRDDPVHRFSGESCLNMTKPISYQSTGCLPKNSTPERINTATPLFDMSTVYGSILQKSLEKGRLFKGGLMRYEIDEFRRIWPPRTKSKENVCVNNDNVEELRCYDSPDDVLNSLLGTNLVGVWMWRNHNRIANELAKMNKCWDDKKIFYAARDINIAGYMQVLLYELLSKLMGKQNLLKDGVILPSSQLYREDYDATLIPQISLEFTSSLRWIHTVQEGSTKHFTPSGQLVKDYPMVNLTLKPGYLGTGRNMDEITAGSYMQAGGGFDYIVDPDIANRGLGQLQRTSDLTATDVSKNRYYGLAPYVDYLHFCRGKSYNTFEDLLEVIDYKNVERLKEVYKNVIDIELMTGMWVEKYVDGGFVPQTFYCLVVDQLVRSIRSDRHWYEREHRPYAFNDAQLQEVRKVTIARILCDVGDSVIAVQPRAFERIAPGNELGSCDNIPSINLTHWLSSCE